MRHASRGAGLRRGATVELPDAVAARVIVPLFTEDAADPAARRRAVVGWAAQQEQVEDVVAVLLEARRVLLETTEGGPGVAEEIDALVGPAARAVSDRALRTALTDPLTGLGTRRAFVEAVGGVLAAAERSGEPVVFVLADLDGLKRINDREGHAAGDATLRAFAAAVTAALRSGDQAYRLGGDEIVLVLPDTDVEAVSALRARLAATRAPAASLGWAVFPRDGGDTSALLEVADARLYDCKRRRRLRRAGVARAGAAAAVAVALTGGAMAGQQLFWARGDRPATAAPSAHSRTHSSGDGSGATSASNADRRQPMHPVGSPPSRAAHPAAAPAAGDNSGRAGHDSPTAIKVVTVRVPVPQPVQLPPVPTPSRPPVPPLTATVANLIGALACTLGCPAAS